MSHGIAGHLIVHRLTPYRRPDLDANQRWTDQLWFCCSCFATEENGSWGGRCGPSDCQNCGAGPQVRISRLAVEEIRRTATWVGKRYYSDPEDVQMAADLAILQVLTRATES